MMLVYIIRCVCPGLLGRRLKRTKEQRRLGERLDSLADLGSFGFVPVIFGYCYGLRDWLSVSVLVLYLLASIARIAYFDSVGFKRVDETEYYTGLPITFAALFFPSLFVLDLFVAKSTMSVILILIYLGMAIAMVAGFQLAKHNPQQPGLPQRYILLPVGAFILTFIYGFAIISSGG